MPRSPETKSNYRPVQTVLRAIVKNRPRTPEEFRKAGIKLRYIDHGVFREVYKIQGCPLVVSFRSTKSRTSLAEFSIVRPRLDVYPVYLVYKR